MTGIRTVSSRIKTIAVISRLRMLRGFFCVRVFFLLRAIFIHLELVTRSVNGLYVL